MIRTRIAATALAAIPLFACAPQPPAEMSMVGDEVRCIPVDRMVSRRPEGPRSLRFELTGGAVFRNELEQACPPLERPTNFDVISLRLHGNQACAGDRFQIVDPAEARAVGFSAFPECRLGRFVAVTD